MLSLASCDSFVTFACTPAGDSVNEITIDGGGFDEYDLPGPPGNCTESFFSYNFHCGPTACFDGCRITEAHADTEDIQFCDNSA